MNYRNLFQHPIIQGVIGNALYAIFALIGAKVISVLTPRFNIGTINTFWFWIIVVVFFIILLLLFKWKQIKGYFAVSQQIPTEKTEIKKGQPDSATVSSLSEEKVAIKAPYNWLESDTYFANCIAQTFPGDRGVVWYNSPSTAVRKLKLFFENLNRDYPDGDTVWWRRGGSAFSIARAEVLDSNKILLENDRFQITRMAVCVSQYYKHFIYIEAAPEPSVCIPPTVVPDDLKEMRGYYTEEYAEFQGRIISRHEYDDGAAIFGEKVVPLHGQARLRVRYLTKVNFVLTAKNSSYNNNRFERLSEEFFNEALESEAGKKKFFEFMDTFQKIDKPEYRR